MKRGMLVLVLMLVLIVPSCRTSRYEYVIQDHGVSPTLQFVAEVAYIALHIVRVLLPPGR